MTTDTSTTAVILCGGLGTRLRGTLNEHCPKALAETAGRPFLDFLLDQIVDSNIAQRIVLCIGHLGGSIRNRYGDNYRSVELVYSSESQPLGTGGALSRALEHVVSSDFIVFNGDSYADVDLRTFLRWSRSRNATSALVSVQVQDAARFGQVRLGAENRVDEFCEKNGIEAPGWIHAGIVFFTCAHAYASWPRQPVWSLEHESLEVDSSILAWPQLGRFIDIGTPAALDDAQNFFESNDPEQHAPRGLILLDRDGTVIEERHYLDDPEQVALLPGVVEGLRAARAAGFAIGIVTNQSGIGRGYFTVERMQHVHERMLRLLDDASVTIDGLWYCPHHPDEGCGCRKPGTDLLQAACTALGFKPADCTVIGDKACDIDMGRDGGAKTTVLVRTGYGERTEIERECDPDFVIDGLEQLESILVETPIPCPVIDTAAVATTSSSFQDAEDRRSLASSTAQ